MMSFLTAFIGASSNIILNLALIPTTGVQGAAIATVASYLLVFIVRCISVKRYIPFKLYSGHIAINTLILFVQAWAMIFEVPYWIIIEAVSLSLMVGINFKFLMGFIETILNTVLKKRSH